MATFLRRDDWVTDAMGNAISGANVYVCSQPANTGSIPPSPLVQIFADSAGVTPITQPLVADGYGHTFFYVAPGTYTIVYNSPQILTLVLADQTIGAGNVSFPITIPEGGTNATTAGQALINLGAAASGTNSDITSLLAVGTPGGANTTSTFNSSGWQFGTETFASGGPTVQVANQSWTGLGVTGLGIGVAGSGGASVITSTVIGTSGAVNCVNFTAIGAAQISGQLAIGSGASGSMGQITSRGNTNSSLIIGGASVTGLTSVLIDSGTGESPVSGTGLLGFNTNYPTQTTVGAAGGASALPATPTGYLQIAIHGTEFVIPFYAKS
jgi:hypothetical protein